MKNSLENVGNRVELMEEIIGEIEYINIEMTQVERKDKLDIKK